ncbi:RNase H-like domain found in reverse transcriptase [Popillia japonica]|uniref:RNase H-like domain found in reverse transcriptase n=1 Tax=Popillia japonica TaxID=7064 RepID=A0AAW1IA36_POPJA
MYSLNASTDIHTDASNLGFGGLIMLQKNGNGQMRPVMYVSRQTSIDERKYHSTELEILSVVWVLEKLRVYLVGISFMIVSNCRALRSTFGKKHLIPCIARWWFKIQEYNFEVPHRRGTQMCHVDALSRNPVDPGEHTEDKIPGFTTEGAQGLTVFYQTLDEPNWLTLAKRQDPRIHEIVDMHTQIFYKGVVAIDDLKDLKRNSRHAYTDILQGSCSDRRLKRFEVRNLDDEGDENEHDEEVVQEDGA